MSCHIDERFEQAVRACLEHIECELLAHTQADTPFVTEVAGHIVKAGGKRFRPTLVTLAAHLGHSVDHYQQGDPLLQLTRAALVVELTHVASLYHDDVMDDADMRRGAPSANRRWNNSMAILVGDYLFSRASTIVADLGTDWARLQSETFARLVQGQIAETRGPQPGDNKLDFYLKVIADKTGSLISTSAVFGGMVAGVPQDQLEALARFGEEIGVVFQLSDDMIDIMSDTTGKTPGTDLREHVPTLPTMMLRAKNRAEDARLLELLDADLGDDALLLEALTLLRENPVIEEAKAHILRRAEVARRYLDPLPDGQAKNALLQLCDQVASRNS